MVNSSTQDDGARVVQFPTPMRVEQALARITVSSDAAVNEHVTKNLHPRIASMLGGKELSGSLIVLTLEETIVAYLVSLEEEFNRETQKATLRQWVGQYVRTLIRDPKVRADALRTLKGRPRR